MFFNKKKKVEILPKKEEPKLFHSVPNYNYKCEFKGFSFFEFRPWAIVQTAYNPTYPKKGDIILTDGITPEMEYSEWFKYMEKEHGTSNLITIHRKLTKKDWV